MAKRKTASKDIAATVKDIISCGIVNNPGLKGSEKRFVSELFLFFPIIPAASFFEQFVLKSSLCTYCQPMKSEGMLSTKVKYQL